MKKTCLIVMAKAPVPGQVKTRLSARYGARGASILYRQMMLQLLRMLSRTRNVDIVLFCAPHTRHPFFHHCRRQFRVILRKQGRGDLGARMFHAFQWGNRRYKKTILMGSDIPEINEEVLKQVIGGRVRRKEVVVMPADDGGYVLMSLRGNHPLVFRDVPWGTNRVMNVTRNRIRQSGLLCRETGVGQDVDTPVDIRRLKHGKLLKGYP